ncbi:MAG: thioredoxin family protein [Sedimentisphaerales bacterium]|nr:thioredoxin family protein [Sedimentisphaerales bacterium]MBN2843028.1 thioredoxin family protein [Sedimentisphaerales bacterium]
MRNLLIVMALFMLCGLSSGQFQPGFGLDSVKTPAVAVPEQAKPAVRVEVVNSHSTLAVGTESVLAIVLDIEPDGHLYANPNTDGIGLPTTLEYKAVAGVEFASPIYPTGYEYEDKNIGSTDMVYDGRVIIYLPLRLTEDYVGDKLELDLSLKGLYCTETQCLPWSESFSVATSVAVEPIVSNNESSIFSGVPLTGHFQPVNDVVSEVSEPVSSSVSIVGNILLAMLGGLIMNVMPCVLPVIPLKVLSIIKQGQHAKASGDSYKALKLSLAFSAGIILLFAVLGLVLSVFNMAYGQQFQYLPFRMGMFLLVFIMSLSMLGLFEVVLPLRLSSAGAVSSGYAGTFMMGIMATLLATPCSAPFLGGILVWALSQSAYMSLVIFISIGVGMAFPYVLLTAFPSLLDKMPAAGNWMVRLKEGFAYIMLAVAVYMVTWFSSNQVVPLLFLALTIAFGFWLSFQVVNFMTPPFKRYIVRMLALVLILVVGYAGFAGGSSDMEQANGLSFAEILSAREDALAQGRPVFMEFTADWCPNCKFVEATVLNTDAFAQAIKSSNTLFLKVDWTNQNDAIKAELERLGSKSVPFSVVFHPEDPGKPIILRDIFTLDAALKALKR